MRLRGADFGSRARYRRLLAMAEITAAQVKTLREKTGAGMLDCKRALTENGGDMEAAVDWLRKKGLAAAQKKAGRVAAEGLVGVASAGRAAAVIEVNSETDFVARTAAFQEFVRAAAKIALASKGDIEATKNAAYPGAGRSVQEELTNSIATIGENMSMRRAAILSVANGVVATYVHSAVAPGLGKIAVLVGVESAGDADRLTEFGRKIAMHIAAANPQAVSPNDLDPVVVKRERAILAEQARASGKPDAVVEKMVDGRMRKFYEDVVLLEQTFVIDGETKVSSAVEAAAKEIGTPIKITGFLRYALGEGIEKTQSNFAAEVAAQAGH
jgi:elongation factor Ts